MYLAVICNHQECLKQRFQTLELGFEAQTGKIGVKFYGLKFWHLQPLLAAILLDNDIF